MKMRNLAMTAMALALAGNISIAYAEHGDDGADRPQGDRPGKLRHKVGRIFNAVDTDGSETITLDEWLVKPTEKAERQFDRIDSDDDNLISPEEFQAIGDGRREDGRRGEGRRGEGRRGDGDVNRDAVRACVIDTTGEDVPEHPDRDTLFAEIDTNDDGSIDIDEFLAVKTDRAVNKFNSIDADGDGAITMQELADAMTQHRERRRTVRDCVEDQRETDDLMG